MRNSNLNEEEHALVLAGTTNRSRYEENEEDLVVRLNATFISEEQLEIAKALEAVDNVSKN